MLLTIAQKSYVNQPVNKTELSDSLLKIKQAVQAFEDRNKRRAIRALYKAYSFLPRNCQGIRICADIMETFMQMDALDEVIQVAHDIEGQYYYHYFDDARTHFNMFRIFANAAEAHATHGNMSQARRFSKMALDHQMETQENVDVEMMQLFMKQADFQ